MRRPLGNSSSHSSLRTRMREAAASWPLSRHLCRRRSRRQS
jgi:hypothetical protein